MWKRCSLEEFRIHANVDVSDAVLKSSDFMLVCYVEIGDAVLSKISKYIGVCYVEMMQS